MVNPHFSVLEFSEALGMLGGVSEFPAASPMLEGPRTFYLLFPKFGGVHQCPAAPQEFSHSPWLGIGGAVTPFGTPKMGSLSPPKLPRTPRGVPSFSLAPLEWQGHLKFQDIQGGPQFVLSHFSSLWSCLGVSFFSQTFKTPKKDPQYP